MSSSDPPPESGPTVPAVLTWGTWIAVVLVAAQLVLGILMLNGSWSLIDAHAGLGYAATLAAAVAAVSAIVWKRRGGATGVMAHAVSMPILMIIQIGLGSAGIKWVHVVLGVLILLGLIGLPMSLRSASRKSA
ncbi:hypothetical protein DUY81_02360 [Acidipropionibacterium acidipropionici]|uniref:Integral membrane protein n=2 Tax=Acidipropionibacterium acidipropionici TaxID=1748 RepID=A0ABN4U815_9ACTN|nr:hypothetical protein A8L58_10825 [Acidipropionibacterium acidipropionici]AZP36803.1 hypothetical protein DUY81_02360 [Acidipropionibacterium acidipropionici]